MKNGDGVYGLRRALVLAGAESQLMSLWPVSDRSTRDLMIGYYELLAQGEARGEALRRAQLQTGATTSACAPVLLGELHPVGRVGEAGRPPDHGVMTAFGQSR